MDTKDNNINIDDKILTKRIGHGYLFWDNLMDQVIRSYDQEPIAYIQRHYHKDIWTVYDEMMRDPDISGAYLQLRSSILRDGWDIVAEPGTDDSAYNVVRAAIYDSNTFEAALKRLLRAIEIGYKVQEIVWRKHSNMDILVPEFYNVHSAYFSFSNNYALLYAADRMNYKDVETQYPRKFLHCVWDDDEVPTGEGNLVKCYWYWYLKKHSLQFWSHFIQRFSDPPIYATARNLTQYITTQTGKQQWIEIMIEFLDNLRSGNSAVFPAENETTIKTIEPSSTSALAEVFVSFNSYLTEKIRIIHLGQTLTSDIGKVGSYAAANIHLAIEDRIVESGRTLIETAINNHLIPWICELNGIGKQDYYPSFHFHRPKQYDIDLIYKLYQMQLPISTKWLYSQYNIPEPEEGEEILPPPTPSGGLI